MCETNKSVSIGEETPLTGDEQYKKDLKEAINEVLVEEETYKQEIVIQLRWEDSDYEVEINQFVLTDTEYEKKFPDDFEISYGHDLCCNISYKDALVKVFRDKKEVKMFKQLGICTHVKRSYLFHFSCESSDEE